MRLLLFSFVVLVSCGQSVCDGSDFVTSQNLCVFSNGYFVDNVDIENVVAVTQKEISFRHPDKYSKEKIEYFDNVSLRFIQSSDSNDWGGELNYKVGSFIDDRYEITLEFKESCRLIQSNLIHELLHVYLIDIEDCVYHRKGWFIDKKFSDEENKASIQNIVFNKVNCIEN